MNVETRGKKKRSMRAKLIFNPSAGAARAKPIKIVDVIHEMQTWKLVPEAFLVEPGCDLPGVIQDALARGIRMFVVCGGDGTILAVARTLAGTPATLGIIPIGTQNNTALSLGIPSDVPAAIEILRTGRRIKVDVGMAVCGKITTPFLEACTVGLDLIMKVLTQIGSASVALAVALVLYLIGDRMLSYELLLGTLTLWLIVELLKFLVHRSRPFIRLTQTRIVGNRARGRSFPSGHTSQVFLWRP